MATLWIREYATIGSAGGTTADVRHPLPIPAEPGVDQSAVTFTTTTQSAAFGATTRLVTIMGSAAFHYVVGANPTATTGALKVPADTPVTFAVTPGHKVAAVTAS